MRMSHASNPRDLRTAQSPLSLTQSRRRANKGGVSIAVDALPSHFSCKKEYMPSEGARHATAIQWRTVCVVLADRTRYVTPEVRVPDVRTTVVAYRTYAAACYGTVRYRAHGTSSCSRASPGRASREVDRHRLVPPLLARSAERSLFLSSRFAYIEAWQTQC